MRAAATASGIAISSQDAKTSIGGAGAGGRCVVVAYLAEHVTIAAPVSLALASMRFVCKDLAG
jgi:hypothetical protein